MSLTIDQTHRADLLSWVEEANSPEHPFPVQNLPLGVFRDPAGGGAIGTRIGDQVLDLGSISAAGLLADCGPELEAAVRRSTLNDLAAVGPAHRLALRQRLSALLSDEGQRAVVEPHLRPVATVQMVLPFDIGDYTDFYASIEHATNVGRLFRPDNPLLPNYRWVPIGYHGRASSVVVSGTPIRRPHGQRKGPDEAEPSFGPCRMLDYELEVGCWVAGANVLGEGTPLADAGDRIFGLSLINDWSARDLQAWEYQPLGPFLAKSFATTTSPWVITAEALAPFRCAERQRGADEPRALDYLRHEEGELPGFDLELDVLLTTDQMRRDDAEPFRVSRGSFARMYWTFAQMLTHHSCNGCNLQPGDLIASGTVSGPERDQYGALLEIARRGAEPLDLPNGEQRSSLQDGDELTLVGRCRRDGFRSIGFGEATGVVQPAG